MLLCRAHGRFLVKVTNVFKSLKQKEKGTKAIVQKRIQSSSLSLWFQRGEGADELCHHPLWVTSVASVRKHRAGTHLVRERSTLVLTQEEKQCKH